MTRSSRVRHKLATGPQAVYQARCVFQDKRLLEDDSNSTGSSHNSSKLEWKNSEDLCCSIDDPNAVVPSASVYLIVYNECMIVSYVLIHMGKDLGASLDQMAYLLGRVPAYQRIHMGGLSGLPPSTQGVGATHFGRVKVLSRGRR